MEIRILKDRFAVCKVQDYSEIDFSLEYVFLAKTPEEQSLVCRSLDLPKNCMAIEEGWRGLKIEGILDFSLKGILYRISKILYREEIGIFVISTYNTDYIFVKEEDLEKAVFSLQKENYSIKGP
ncbi:MAG: ACT domain-containing protein [Gallicola sp.]|nr:ACT domain-containing protein [Gallicola sp.]